MNSNLSVSAELIHLLGWLLKHERKALLYLVNKSVASGLLTEIDQHSNVLYDEKLHAILHDFLAFMEESLVESVQNTPTGAQVEEKLISDVRKIDSCALNKKILKQSIHQVKKHLHYRDQTKNAPESTPNKDAARLLFKQLLKNWKPTKQDLEN